MSKTLWFVLFILVASTAFPLIGYYFDYKNRRKLMQPKIKSKE